MNDRRSGVDSRAGNGPGKAGPFQYQRLTVGDFEVEVRPLGASFPSPAALAIRHRRQRRRAGRPPVPLFATPADGRFLEVAVGPVSYEDHFGGTFEVQAATRLLASFPLVDEPVASSSRSMRLSGVLAHRRELAGEQEAEQEEVGSSSGGVRFSMEMSEEQDGDLRLVVELDTSGLELEPMEVVRLVLVSVADPDESFFGFGEQLTYCDLRGQVVPLISQEHGIGRGLPLVTEGVNSVLPGAGGTPVSTGSASAFWHTSRGRSLLVEGSSYGEVDLTSPATCRFEHHDSRVLAHVLFGEDPLDLLGRSSLHTGRMSRLPGWVHQGAILGLQGGTARVEEAVGQALAAGVKLSAVWLQDWCGQRQSAFGSQLWWDWHLDEVLYPDWSGMVARLEEADLRVLTYVNPYLSVVPGHDRLYSHARRHGYLVLDLEGEPYLIQNSDVGSAVVDLSNDEACEWMAEVIAGMVEATGCSGWMADFGEGLPMEGVRIAGGDPREFHNAYPVAWAAVNRQAARATGRGDEILPFHRSGFTTSPGYLTSSWLGDQLQSWDEYDGMKSAVTGMVSGGLSGFAVVHSDVGGYLSLPNPFGGERLFLREEELLMRWMELGALSPVMRTHEGLDPSANLQWCSTSGLLSHFRRCSLVYLAWSSYRQGLAEEATSTGAPIVRHPYLHYPDDPATWGLRHQYMLGAELMVAPVLDPGVEEVRAYLPAGRWQLLWTGETFGREDEGTWATIPAPLGSPAILSREGSRVGAEVAARLPQE